MANITASMVKELRERTGSGMMECKKALTETNGDIEAAIDVMRKSGMAKADKKAGRVAAEGTVAFSVSADNTKGVMVEINSETDFVSKGDDFQQFAGAVAEAALSSGANTAEILAEQTLPSGKDIETTRRELIAKIGENITVRRVVQMQSEDGMIATYKHGEKIGVMVAMKGGNDALGRDIAMHIAASQPQAIGADDVDSALIEKEREIFTAQAKESGKPDNIIEKMIDGRIRKFLEEITLLGQSFVKNPDQTVEKLLKAEDASVTAFHRLAVGEGIEKEEVNFAEEVAAQAAAAQASK